MAEETAEGGLEEIVYEKGPFVREITASGKPITGTYLVRKSKRNITRFDKPFYNLKLTDKTGDITAMIFDNADLLMSGITEGDYVRVEGNTDSYEGSMQIKVVSITGVPEEQINWDDFVFALPNEQMDGYLTKIVEMLEPVKDPYLNKLFELIFNDEELMYGFKHAPASVKIHNAFVGGLIEHTYNVMKKALALAETERRVDYALTLTGAFIHDLGKIYSYEWKKGVLESGRGKEVGHVYIGQEIISEKIREISEFPDNLKESLLGYISGHHGDFSDHGVKPVTEEGHIIHAADYLQSRLEIIHEARKNNPEADWVDVWPLGHIKFKRVSEAIRHQIEE